eukprot:CAMPEP_0172194912 /NCGR_PEP_ID=MMETSP1050-20130122/25880_1 /TAXON_ID=233186 /ORGANISM="Cryptomonas curvata, Strain CCAP979/52" /LENGTH=94 /DNA_ID=CAMNT_0012870845 /DNA_START=571 /DNA_END=852 /DNA_ORIENTATION=-
MASYAVHAASHRIFFYLIKVQSAEWHGYTEESPFHPGSWDRFASSDLLPDGLLVSDEVDFLRDYGACRHKPCLSWAAVALERIIDEHEHHPKAG